ncbi:4-hydroxy-tetrahydrodipicolinate reductase [Hyphomicrobiales bacterium]|nr:4-hydroxy-tetrahydrodipicolinate reductase [Hyphomicrobiales bacterium]CAH1692686.1 4-hydroxy-tetrahydrodipicolinate reductase [Hyphomicrobiales bacterium]
MTGTTTRTANIVLYGVGALGGLVMKALQADYPMIRVVGAIDHDPAKTGKRLQELFPMNEGIDGIVVAPDLKSCLEAVGEKVDVVLHMTESKPAAIEAQLGEILEAGINVVSAAESMFYPGLRYSGFTERLHALAVSKGVTITGAGINPGYIFDAIPLTLARATSDVKSVTLTRAIDVTGTGPGDIEHVGYGLWPDEFKQKIAAGQIEGHMGMPESIVLIAERLNMDIDRIEERWETETASFPVDSGDASLGILEAGRVIGISQYAEGKRGDETVISMSLIMYYQPEKFGLEIADRIEIVGAHHIRASLVPAALSLFGAANTVVNCVQDVLSAAPGVANILDFGMGGANRSGFTYAVDPDQPPRPGRMSLVKKAI